MKKVITCFFLSLFFISCGNSQEIKSITTSELKDLLAKEKIQLIDVRTPKETKQGFIETALFANFYSDSFYTDATKQIDKNKVVYLYCRSGSRSLKASKMLQEKGYKIVNVLGGYNKWKQEN
ncbi:rhodanese-like domain-containing protein [Polaribacter sp. MSW13]|uniref:Rhodanese-like domain-containing protein n=1 Tax=Polaribacter marinus TaxID=2916838 RepID=A0A9X1VM83_9FLAO|nr:rhodanese-like domain-containing protein [Polaribacter marinus]MCI2228726.1 rhodanese-like domain-containing protein [Polaribacter marinus]